SPSFLPFWWTAACAARRGGGGQCGATRWWPLLPPSRGDGGPCGATRWRRPARRDTAAALPSSLLLPSSMAAAELRAAAGPEGEGAGAECHISRYRASVRLRYLAEREDVRCFSGRFPVPTAAAHAPKSNAKLAYRMGYRSQCRQSKAIHLI